jgi:hypothetical protein
VDRPFHVELVQHRLLERVRGDLQTGERDGRVTLRGPEGPVEASAVTVRVVVFEAWIGPVRVEGAGELVQQKRRIAPGETDIPLQTVHEGRSGQVGRAHVARVPAGVAAE